MSMFICEDSNNFGFFFIPKWENVRIFSIFVIQGLLSNGEHEQFIVHVHICVQLFKAHEVISYAYYYLSISL